MLEYPDSRTNTAPDEDPGQAWNVVCFLQVKLMQSPGSVPIPFWNVSGYFR